MAANDGPARDGWGRYTDSLEGAERDAAAARLYREVRNYQKVADELGYSSKGDAWRAVKRCRSEVRQQAGAELIAVEAAELDQLYVRALDILDRDHVTVSQGRVMKDDNGLPLLDDGPKLAAIREMRSIRESYRKLLGLDAATKTEATVTTVPQDAELQERVRLAKERVAEREQRILDGDDEA